MSSIRKHVGPSVLWIGPVTALVMTALRQWFDLSDEVAQTSIAALLPVVLRAMEPHIRMFGSVASAFMAYILRRLSPPK